MREGKDDGICELVAAKSAGRTGQKIRQIILEFVGEVTGKIFAHPPALWIENVWKEKRWNKKGTGTGTGTLKGLGQMIRKEYRGV